MKRAFPLAVAAVVAAALALHFATGDRARGPGDATVDRGETEDASFAPAALADVAGAPADDQRRRADEGERSSTGTQGVAAEEAVRGGEGGRLVVRFTGSAAGAEDATPGDHFRLVARGRAGEERVEREPTPATSGALEFVDLPSESGWRVLLTADRFVDQYVSAPLVAPGETAVVAVPLERGLEVSGRVVDGAGAPIPGARVSVSTWRHFDAALMPGRNAVAHTGDDGRFDAAGVEGGELSLRVTANGFLSGASELGRRANGESISDVVVRLDRGRSVTGVVVWPDGSPAAGADVRVATPGRSWGRRLRAEADEDGRFAISGLAETAWRVGAWLEHPDEGVLWRALAELAGPGDVRLVLERGAALAGVVVDDAGAPVGWASVTATAVGRDGGAAPVRTRSDRESGAFELSGLGPGQWDVTAAAKGHGDPASIARVRVPLEMDALQIVLPRSGAIAGVVLDPAGAPVPGATVAGRGRTSETDAEGRFALEDVEPGAIALEVTGTEVVWGPPREPVVPLGAGERLEGVVVRLTRGGRIVGEVHPAARTQNEITVLLRPHDGYSTEAATVDGEGRFTYEGVPPGRYRLCFDWMDKGDWITGYQVRREVFVDVVEGETTRAVLGDPAAYPVVVSGVVRDGGEPVEGLLMYIFDPDASQNQPLMVARTDVDGRYEAALPGSGPTLFTVGYGQQRQARFLRDLSSEPVQRVDFDLPTGSLRGRLVLGDGSPPTGRFVVLTHADAEVGTIQLGQAQFALSRSDGTFLFEGLHPGEYRLRSGGYVQPNATDGVVVVDGVVIPDEGEAPPVEIVVPDGAVLNVRATDGAGGPVAGASVQVLLEGGRWPSVLRDGRSTAYDGSLRFTGLAPGPATAVVRDADGRELGRADVELTPGGAHDIEVVCAGR